MRNVKLIVVGLIIALSSFYIDNVYALKVMDLVEPFELHIGKHPSVEGAVRITIWQLNADGTKEIAWKFQDTNPNFEGEEYLWMDIQEEINPALMSEIIARHITEFLSTFAPEDPNNLQVGRFNEYVTNLYNHFKDDYEMAGHVFGLKE